MGRLRWWGWVVLMGGSSSTWSFVWVHTGRVGAIPNKETQGTPDHPLDPPSRFLLGKDWPRTSWGSSYADKDDSFDLPLLTVGSSSIHGSKWPLMWWMGSQNIFHTWGPVCKVLLAGDWQWYPCFGPPFLTRGSGSLCWSGIACLGHVCLSTPLP